MHQRDLMLATSTLKDFHSLWRAWDVFSVLFFATSDPLVARLPYSGIPLMEPTSGLVTDVGVLPYIDRIEGRENASCTILICWMRAPYRRVATEVRDFAGQVCASGV